MKKRKCKKSPDGKHQWIYQKSEEILGAIRRGTVAPKYCCWCYEKQKSGRKRKEPSAKDKIFDRWIDEYPQASKGDWAG